MVFQYDNDPKHTSIMAQNWFKKNKIEVLDWPSKYPGLNPIEHLWFYLKRRMGSYKVQPLSIYELWKRVQDEWNNIPNELCLELINSMPRRISAVLKARGGNIKY